MLVLVPPTQASPSVYPPSGCILLQRSLTVPLRWQLAGRRFELEVYSEGRAILSRSLTSQQFDLPVSPGSSYGWTVTPSTGKPITNSFTLASKFEYRKDGQPGTGESGGRIQARLERDASGMNLWLNCGQENLRYLFVEPGIQFLLSARGGDGKQGGPGQSSAYPPCRPGQQGGAGGWGGRIDITTVSCPWKEYLKVDVSPGKPGPGGPGGISVFAEGVGVEGEVGPPGQEGVVTTTIAQP